MSNPSGLHKRLHTHTACFYVCMYHTCFIKLHEHYQRCYGIPQEVLALSLHTNPVSQIQFQKRYTGVQYIVHCIVQMSVFWFWAFHTKILSLLKPYCTTFEGFFKILFYFIVWICVNVFKSESYCWSCCFCAFTQHVIQVRLQSDRTNIFLKNVAL